MEHTEKREEPARRVVIDRDTLGQALAQEGRPLIMKRAPPHIDGLDLGGAGAPDRIEIILADQKIIFDDAPEGRERQRHLLDHLALHGADLEDEPVLFDLEMEMEGGRGTGDQREAAHFEKIEDRHRPLMLDIGLAPEHGALIERDPGDIARQRRSATESACASSPSARASVTAAGPIAFKLASVRRMSEVRFMKSSVPSPEEKRALLPVGSTWLGPPT